MERILANNATTNQPQYSNRRNFFSTALNGVAGAGLTGCLLDDFFASPTLAAKSSAPREPRAKALIQLFMNGGPSQMDLFDPKPLLNQLHGRPYLNKLSASDVQDPEQAGNVFGSPYQFRQHGESGMWVSEVFPHIAEVVDDIAFVRSLVATSPSHPPAVYEMHCGKTEANLPTLGSWVSYGLGTENKNLPSFVVLDDPDGLPVTGTATWQSGYLPPVHQGTRLRSQGSPILNLHPQEQGPTDFVAAGRDLLSKLDNIHQRDRPFQPRLDARIASYELAARLQVTASEALDLSRESRATLEMYGVDRKSPYSGRLHAISGPDSYARRCIMARRLIERGVRVVQIVINSQLWDMHSHLENDLWAASYKTDQPVAALLRDLKQRGLLDSTLVVWGGEFGRLPIAQFQRDVANAAGRDHNQFAATAWMAGGGVKGGALHGTTDDLGYRVVENPVSIADWNATILHQLGLHHDNLFFERRGLKERLTGVERPRVVREILA